MLGSVRVRLTLVTTLALALALGSAATLLVRTVRETTKQRIRHDNATFLTQLRASIGSGAQPNELPLPPPGTVFYIRTANGSTIVSNSPGAVGTGLGGTATGGGAAGGTAGAPGTKGSSTSLPDSRDNVVVTSGATTPRGRVTLIAASPLTEVRHSIDALARLLIIAIPLLVLAVGAVAWFLVGRALRPVDAIRSQVEDISHTTLDRRVPVPGGRDEVARLALTMNDMLDRLEGSSARQREFVSDASHELRSPIASIHAAIEIALRHPARADWESVGTQVLSESGRLDHIVSELLELARTEEQSEVGPRRTVELDEVVRGEVERLHAVRDDVRLDARAVSGAQVVGARPQLERVVRNLLDNAARHATTRIAVALHDDGDHVELTVDDDGPGIGPDDRERVFERFVRLDDARHRGGVGLGLAMVRAIVTRHAGTVRASASGLGGARFTVRLPTASVPVGTRV